MFDFIYSNMPIFLCVFCRVAGFVVSAPVLRAKGVPKKVRVFFIFVISLLVFLTFELRGVELEAPALSMVLNFICGAIVGMLVMVAFEMFSIGGHFIAMGSGLGFSVLADPTSNGQATSLANFYKISASLIFVSSGGILALFIILKQSFDVFDLNLTELPNLTQEYVLAVFKYSLTGALLLSAPMLFTTLLVNIAFGVISKSSPSMNIFSVGLPVTILVTILFMTMTIDSLPILVLKFMNDVPGLIWGDLGV